MERLLEPPAQGQGCPVPGNNPVTQQSPSAAVNERSGCPAQHQLGQSVHVSGDTVRRADGVVVFTASRRRWSGVRALCLVLVAGGLLVALTGAAPVIGWITIVLLARACWSPCGSSSRPADSSSPARRSRSATWGAGGRVTSLGAGRLMCGAIHSPASRWSCSIIHRSRRTRWRESVADSPVTRQRCRTRTGDQPVNSPRCSTQQGRMRSPMRSPERTARTARRHRCRSALADAAEHAAARHRASGLGRAVRRAVEDAPWSDR